MELEPFVSAITGGGLVLLLAQFIFVRLIHQVDRIADKISKIDVMLATLTERIEKLDHLEDKLETASMRLVRLETITKMEKNGALPPR